MSIPLRRKMYLSCCVASVPINNIYIYVLYSKHALSQWIASRRRPKGTEELGMQMRNTQYKRTNSRCISNKHEHSAVEYLRGGGSAGAARRGAAWRVSREAAQKESKSSARTKRKRTVKGSQGRKRAAYLDWAQEDRDSEGIHLVLLELVTGQGVISAVSAPRQRVSLCVPIIAPYSIAYQSISITRFPRIYEIVRFSMVSMPASSIATRFSSARLGSFQARAVQACMYIYRAELMTRAMDGWFASYEIDPPARETQGLSASALCRWHWHLTPLRIPGRISPEGSAFLGHHLFWRSAWSPPVDPCREKDQPDRRILSQSIIRCRGYRGYRDFRVYAALLVTSAPCQYMRGIETTILAPPADPR